MFTGLAKAADDLESVKLVNDPAYKGPRASARPARSRPVTMPPLAPRPPPPVCLSGSPANLSLQRQFASSQRLFKVERKLGQKPATFADHFHAAPKGRQPASKAKVVKRIKKACVIAAMKRQSGGQGYLCRSLASEPIAIGSADARGPCVTADMAEYITWAVNSAVACMNSPGQSLDPLVVLRKFNNETGFAYFQGGASGVGLGQLTSSAIREVNRTAKQSLAPFRNLKAPACAPFREALSKRAPASAGQRCQFLHYSEGVSNNLMYSLAYLVHSRDNLLENFEREARKCGIKRQDVYDTAALASYGPEGAKVEKTLLKILKKNCRNPAGFIKDAQRQIAYLKQTQAKMREMIRLAGPGIKKEQDCLE